MLILNSLAALGQTCAHSHVKWAAAGLGSMEGSGILWQGQCQEGLCAWAGGAPTGEHPLWRPERWLGLPWGSPQ